MTGDPAPRLPFTVIDQAVHLFDSPAEPWGVQLELALRATLDEDRLRAAIRQALARHPLARARQLPARLTDREWCWEVAPEPEVEPLRVVDCADDDALAATRATLYSRQVPLVEAPPLRLVLARGPQGASLLLNANHAAFDGVGCLRLLQSVARAYTGEPDPDPPVSLAQARDVQGLLAAADGRARARRFRLLASKLADIAVRPARLATDGGSDEPGYGFHHVVLSKDQTAALLSGDGGPTVNDVLLVALTVAVVGWNEEHGRRAGRVGILMPVNLRPKAWREDVVTNLVLDARVVTMASQRTEPAALLRAISEQTDRVKAGAGPALIEVIGGWTSLPLWAKQLLSPLLWFTGNRLVDTALMSNLGTATDELDFGPGVGVPEHAWFSAPTRMPCGLSVGVLTVGGRLHVTFRYRRPLLGAAAAAQLARCFVAELERAATISNGDSPSPRGR
ncbi:hypothetical protein BH20ACT2_BH20ACT2_14900 [soil metagenome]